MRYSKTGRKTSAVWHVAPSCWNLFNFCEQKFFLDGPITIAIKCNGHPLLIFEEKWPNYASGSKSAPSRFAWVDFSKYMHAGFLLCPRSENFACLHRNQNEHHLKWWFVLTKSTFSVSRSQANFPALFKRTHNHKQRIKLIICQIRHELSITIQEISTIWKKKLSGGSVINFNNFWIRFIGSF